MFFLLIFHLAAAAADDEQWSEPFVGVRYLHRTTDNPKWSIHAVFVDLTEPSVRVTATTPENKGSTTSAFAQKQNVQVAVNGDFFNLKTREPLGLAIGEGKHFPGSQENNPQEGFVAAGAGGRVEIFAPERVAKPEPWMQAVVGGRPMLLRNGAPDPREVLGGRHPRTAVGLTKDRKTLILFVVDGRQKHSVGMNGSEMQQEVAGFGAWTALNLDGGGSTAMYIEGLGVVNSPSDGRERVDANHLGVVAVKGRQAPAKGQVRGVVKEAGTGAPPLADAKVSLTPTHFDTSTDKGFFHLSQVPAGEQTLIATRDGYQPGRVTAKVEAGRIVEASIELTPLRK